MSRRTKVLALGVTTVVGVIVIVVGAVLLQLDGYRADAGAEANPTLWFLPLAGVVLTAVGVVGVMLVNRKQTEMD